METKTISRGYPNVSGVRELKNWRMAGYRLHSTLKEDKKTKTCNIVYEIGTKVVHFNVNHVVSCEPVSEEDSEFLISNLNRLPNGEKSYIIKMVNNDMILVSEENAWTIMEGEQWFEFHKDDLGENIYNRIKHEYYEKQNFHNSLKGGK